MGVIFLDWSAGATKQWEFIGGTETDNSTLTLPSSIVSGDLLIIFNSSTDDPGPPTAVVPSGFTTKLNNTFSRLNRISRATTLVKIANGTESSTNVSLMAGEFKSAICLQFRPQNFSISSVGNITCGNADQDGDYDNPSTVTAGTTSVKLPAIAIGRITSYYGTAQASFSNQTPTFDDQISVTPSSNGFKQTVGWRIQNDSLQSQGVDGPDGGLMNWQQVFQLYDNGI